MDGNDERERQRVGTSMKGNVEAVWSKELGFASISQVSEWTARAKRDRGGDEKRWEEKKGDWVQVSPGVCVNNLEDPVRGRWDGRAWT